MIEIVNVSPLILEIREVSKAMQMQLSSDEFHASDYREKLKTTIRKH